MRRWLSFLVLAGLIAGAGGCKKGTSTLQLTVTSSAAIHGVDHLRVTVTNNGMTAKPLDFPLSGRPVDLPPQQTLTLVFGADRRGAVSLAVEARDAAEHALGSATKSASVTPGAASTASITLTPAAVLPPSYTVTALPSGLGGGVSSGGGFVVEGALGLPGPRVVARGGASGLTVEPLILTPRSPQ